MIQNQIKNKNQDQGFVLFSVLLILSLMALIFSGLVISLENFIKMTHTNQQINQAWAYSQKAYLDLRKIDLNNFKNLKTTNIFFNQNNFQSRYFIQEFSPNKLQITWETGTKTYPDMVIHQVWVNSGVWGKPHGLSG